MPANAPSTMGGAIVPMPLGGDVSQDGGRRRRGASVKTLKKLLKKAGLKTTGKKAALTRRAKKAHLKLRGGDSEPAGGCGPNMKWDQTADGGKGKCVPEDDPMSAGRKRRGSKKGKLGLMGY